MLRAVVFTATGLLFGASSLVMLGDPNFQHPATALDWFATLSLSAALLALAVALPMLARLVGGRRLYLVSVFGAFGAAVAGIANLVEDGLQLDWAFLPFIAGALIVQVGLVGMTVLMFLRSDNRTRLLALVPLITAVDILALHAHGGGVVVAMAWIGAAFVALRAPTQDLKQDRICR